MEENEVQAPPGAGAVRRLADDPSSRKRFLRMVGGTGAAGAFAIFLAACGEDEEEEPPTDTVSLTDIKGDLEIVNYALTLEYLEAAFYRDVIDSGEVKNKQVADLAVLIGENEQEHVDALAATVEQLGGTPAEEPNTDFEEAISGGEETILQTAAAVENLGAAAYLGQAGNVDSAEVLAALLSIHSVEARHAAALNQLAGNSYVGREPLTGTIPDGAFAKPLDKTEVLKEIEPFIAS